MTIKKKLLFNMLLTVSGFILIAGFSLVGMKFVQKNLAALTEKSTPYQLKTIEFQRSLQAHTSNLLKVASAEHRDDFSTATNEADTSIAETRKVFKELSEFKSDVMNDNEIDELSEITGDMINISGKRIQATEDAKISYQQMETALSNIYSKLDQMDKSVKKLQNGSMEQLSSSNDSVKKITKEMKNVQLVVYSLKDLKQAISDIVAADTITELTIAKSRYNSSIRWLTQSDLLSSGKDTSSVRSITDGLSDISKYVTGSGGLSELKDALLKNPNDETKNKLTSARAIVNQKLAQMTTIVGDIDEKSAESFNSENTKLDNSLNNSNYAARILTLNNEIINAGLDIDRLLHEGFLTKDLSEMDKLTSEMRESFNRADSAAQKMSDILSTLKKTEEIKLIKNSVQSLHEIRDVLLAQGGVVEKLKNVLKVNEQVTALNGRLKAFVASQQEKGQAGVSSAQSEQEKSVKAVNSAVRNYIISIAVICVVVLGIGIITSKMIANSITSPVNELVNLAEEFGDGNFSRKMDESRKDEFGRVASHFNKASENLTKIVSEIATTINDLAMRSIMLQSSAESITRGSQEQTIQTEQSSTAMTEMSHSITDVARNAVDTTVTSKETTELAKKGKDSVDQTVQGMINIAKAVKESSQIAVSLGESSKNIGKVVDVINDIAAQINLLALNAAIEAARAGDYGRGFAVVADEVRNLSERTVGSTQEIASIISSIQNSVTKAIEAMKHGETEVEAGVKLAESAKASLDMIVAASEKEADMVHRIAAASEEQSAVSSQVSVSMETIARITKEMNNSIADIKKTSDDLYTGAEALSTAAAWFKRE